MKNIIIIGSGLGGLVAGNLLAQRGHKVTIMESHTSPGGYTAGFRRKGFYFESGTLTLETSATVFKAMQDIGVFEKIDFVRMKTRYVSPENDYTVGSYEDYKKMLHSRFTPEKDNLDKYFREVDMLSKLMGRPEKPIPYLLDGFSYFTAMLSYALRLLRYMKVIGRYKDMTIDEFVEGFFPKDTEPYRVLKNIGYPQMSTILAGVGVSMIDDYWTVRGGMQSWADTLSDNFRGLGGELLLKTYVSKILTKEGAVTGVVSNGKEYAADYVVAACDYKKTFLNLLDDTSSIGTERMEKIQTSHVSEGVFTVYLGLDMSCEELREEMKVPHVRWCGDEAKMEADVNNPYDGDFFRKRAILLYSPSLVNPDLAPAGKSSLMIQALAPHYWMQNWRGGDKERYLALKEEVKRTLIEKAGKLIPNLEKHIIVEDAATPLTYERYTHNSNGATSSWSWNPQKKFYDDMFMSEVRTPVKNLFIGSCWSSEAGGVPGAICAAYLCVKMIGKR